MFSRYAFLAVILLGVTSVYLVSARGWRRSVIALALQYLAAFWLVALVFPMGLALIKLVVGWMSCAILASTPEKVPPEDVNQRDWAVWVFRILAAVLVWIVVISVLPGVTVWLPIRAEFILGGLGLIGLGLLQLGMTNRPLRVVVGILTALTGFEILYANVELSVLVSGLLAIITLGLALVGAYLAVAAEMGEEPS